MSCFCPCCCFSRRNCSFIVVAGVYRHFGAAHFFLLLFLSSFLSQTHWHVSVIVSEHLSSSTFAAAVHLLLLLCFCSIFFMTTRSHTSLASLNHFFSTDEFFCQPFLHGLFDVFFDVVVMVVLAFSDSL